MAKSSDSATAAATGALKIAGLEIVNWKRVGLAVFLGLLCLMPFWMGSYDLSLLTQAMSYAVALLGLNILTGYNGQFSLGHGAFFALGAYVAATLIFHLDVPYYLTIPAAGLVCLVFGFLFGLPALRLEGLYLALATFALAVATPQLLKFHVLEPLTGGVQGLDLEDNLEDIVPFGLPLDEDQWIYYFTFAVTLAMFVIGWNLLRGRPGRAMVAIRDHRIAAETMGINITIYKSWTFGVSALFTGVGGALTTILVKHAGPDHFGFFLSVALLVGMVIGGLASITGAIYGAIFVQYAQDFASDLAMGANVQALSWAIWGVFMIACMYLMPMGVAGTLRYAGIWVRQRWLKG